MVQELKYLHDFEQAISSSALSMVDWYALWCLPCLKIAPRIDELSRDYPSVKFYKIDVDAASDIASQANITAMPTFHFYKNGKLIDTVVGANLNAIKKKLNALA